MNINTKGIKNNMRGRGEEKKEKKMSWTRRKKDNEMIKKRLKKDKEKRYKERKTFK